MKKIIAILCVAVSLSTSTVPFAEAGRQNGPGQDTTVVEARGSVTYHITFWGNEQARVAIVGDGDTDLDVFV